MSKFILPGMSMSPLLIITAAVLGGLWARRFRCIINNCTNPSPSKVDSTSDDSFQKLDGEIPISDCLTDLPDEILSYILTRLTLRDVLRMTTLSKRWKNIWLSLPNLDLEWRVMSGHNYLSHSDGCDLYKQAYVKRVNKVLLDYDNQDISSFRISFCFTKADASHVDHWISFASKKRVESLTLMFICYENWPSIGRSSLQKRMMPENMYTITSSILSRFPCLKDLCLGVCKLKLHSDFRFNKLVRLDLYHVVLEENNQLQWMLSNSSTIEWLRIRQCNLPEKLCIGKKLQRLSSLTIQDLSDLREIEFNTNSLKFLHFVGRAYVKFSFLNAANLKTSHVFFVDRGKQGAECIIRGLATLPSLQSLFLEGSYPLIHVIPTHNPSTLFRSIVRLSLLFKHEVPEVDMVKSFPRILSSFQQLRKLYLMVPYGLCHRRYELPDVCLNTSIKEIEIGNFKLEWIPCAIYFLKSAVALDRMLISPHVTKYTYNGEWERSPNSDPFSQQLCDCIRLALQGNAVSPNADLIIG